MDNSNGRTGRSVDARVYGLASRQHGAVARWQLLRAGVPSHAIDYRVKASRLRVLHRGVYQVGPVTGLHLRPMAAILACGDDAVLSHWSAADLWGVSERTASGEPVHVSLRRHRRGPRQGVRIHRVGSLPADEVCRRFGIPLTRPARTLLDLAGCAEPRELERVVARARRDRLVSTPSVLALLDRHTGRAGCRALRMLLEADRAPSFTRSDAEAHFLELVRRAALPHPRCNAVIENLEVDFLWLERRLVVEIDGFRYHSGRDAFERDRLRDARLTAAGLRVMRLTWRQLTRDPEAVLVRLTRALSSG